MRFQFTESSHRVYDYTEALGEGRITIRVFLINPLLPRLMAWIVTPEGDQFPVSIPFSDLLLVLRDAAFRCGESVSL